MARIKIAFSELQQALADNSDTRHNEAIDRPKGFEVPMVRMLHFWEMYAEEHKKRYESPIGDDPFTGEHWAAIGTALRGLLNCETGRLSCGQLSEFILGTMTENGFELDDDGDPIKVGE